MYLIATGSSHCNDYVLNIYLQPDSSYSNTSVPRPQPCANMVPLHMHVLTVHFVSAIGNKKGKLGVKCVENGISPPGLSKQFIWSIYRCAVKAALAHYWQAWSFPRNHLASGHYDESVIKTHESVKSLSLEQAFFAIPLSWMAIGHFYFFFNDEKSESSFFPFGLSVNSVQQQLFFLSWSVRRWCEANVSVVRKRIFKETRKFSLLWAGHRRMK